MNGRGGPAAGAGRWSAAAEDLPLVDEHATPVATNVDAVWLALLDTLQEVSSRVGVVPYAWIVGCADRTASGPRPLAEGSTVPGFRVVTARPPAELVLLGRHRFSSYALTFRLDDLGRRSVLRAETRATFPGIGGRVYRQFVIGTGGHAVVVRRLLGGVRRRTELRTPDPT